MLRSRQEQEENHDVKITKGSFENVAQFKYPGGDSNISKFDSGRN
jgi:hypothetical protein